ncbi:MAG: type II toxin-antitoxin system VapC family toxin [Armatimonadetes bacterium]|nr:type II toxin-antitoxin system VapC family toxin [Akkermansiaceae bacterium]
MQSVYIETTIPSYLTSRKSRQAALAADQDATRFWWDDQRRRFRLFTSVFTLAEAGAGDPTLAGKRLAALAGIPTLDIPDDFESLESDIIQLLQLPDKAATDASHLALAIVHKMDYLLTWNCTHLANAILQKELIDYCGYHQLHVPVICTPETLIRQQP